MTQAEEMECAILRSYVEIRKNEGRVDKATAKPAKKSLEKLKQLLKVMGPEFHHSFLAVHKMFMELEDCGF